MVDARELGVLRVAKPCSVAWSSMRGSNTVRTCDQCRLKVHDFSKLSVAEAKRVLDSSPGSPCAVLYQRHDGTILTMDCPLCRRLLATRLAGLVVASVIVLLALLGFETLSQSLRESVEVRRLTGVIVTCPRPHVPRRATGGVRPHVDDSRESGPSGSGTAP